MSRSDDERLADIRDACAELAEVVGLHAVGDVSELLLTRAAERLLEIIGEAANHLSEAARADYPQIDWRSVARLRIVLAHHYHRTDPALVWTYAREHVPRLARDLED